MSNPMTLTASIVDLQVPNNATFQQGLQFGVVGDTSW